VIETVVEVKVVVILAVTIGLHLYFREVGRGKECGL
jgi:hypothetical protein